LATFANGRFEEFLDCLPLHKEDLRDPTTSSLIAAKLAALHRLGDSSSPDSPIHPSEIWDTIEKYLKMAQTSINLIMEAYPERLERGNRLSLQDGVFQQLKALRSVFETVLSPKIVLAHNDLQYGNILRHAVTGEMILVDYEYSSYNYRGYDIANHFCEWMADYHGPIPHTLNPKMYPTQEERAWFYRNYLAACIDSTKDVSPDSISEADVEALDKEVQSMTVISHLMWGLWGIVREADMLGRREIDFDFWEYGAARIEWFLQDYSATLESLFPKSPQ
jgi:choline/ethanolamine kinase